jgi:hypothetical protein
MKGLLKKTKQQTTANGILKELKNDKQDFSIQGRGITPQVKAINSQKIRSSKADATF